MYEIQKRDKKSNYFLKVISPEKTFHTLLFCVQRVSSKISLLNALLRKVVRETVDRTYKKNILTMSEQKAKGKKVTLQV